VFDPFVVPLGVVYSVLKDGWALLRGGRRRLTASDVIALRKKRKEEIEDKLLERRQQKLSADVIVRDVKRVNKYPDVEQGRRGISPWFKAGLMGTYHRGVLLGLRWEDLTLDAQERWR
jgi:hypothetical protein